MEVAKKLDERETSRLGVTRALVDFVTATGFEDLPKGAVDGAKFSFLDTLGVCVGGTRERGPRIVADFVRQAGGKGISSVVAQGFKASPPHAAWINGTAADVLGFSDITVAHMTHPSASICPAVWAVAESSGANGKDAVVAHVLGVEVANKIGAGMKPDLQIKGWHPLAVLNTFGAAAAAGKLLGLDAEPMADALGIAGAEASGVRAAFGTMSKSYGAGRAARDGITAAMLAGMGFTGPRDVLEGRDGILQTFGESADGGRILEHLGNPFDFISPGMTYKAYPTCTRSHPGIKGALELKGEHGFSADDVDRVECAVSPAVEDYLKFPLPETKLQAKYSMQFCVALALVEGEVTLSAITEERVHDPGIVDLMKRVTMYVSPELAKLGYAPDIAPYGCTVTITLKDGTRLHRRVDQVPWNPAEPPSWDDLAEKYRDCWEGVLGAGGIGESLDIVRHLEDAKATDIERLMTLVRSQPR